MVGGGDPVLLVQLNEADRAEVRATRVLPELDAELVRELQGLDSGLVVLVPAELWGIALKEASVRVDVVADAVVAEAGTLVDGRIAQKGTERQTVVPAAASPQAEVEEEHETVHQANRVVGLHLRELEHLLDDVVRDLRCLLWKRSAIAEQLCLLCPQQPHSTS